MLLISVAVPLLKMPPVWRSAHRAVGKRQCAAVADAAAEDSCTENSDSAEVHCESAVNNQELTLDTSADDGGRCSTARDGEISSYNQCTNR